MTHASRSRRQSTVVLLALATVAVVAACGTTAPLKERLELQAVANGQGGALPSGLTASDGAAAPVVTATDGAEPVPSTAPEPGTVPEPLPGTPATGPSAASTRAGTAATTGKPSATRTTGAAKTSTGALKPIQLGFVSTDTSNSGSLGVGSGSTVTNNAIINAAVKGMNAAGGVGGHQVVPVIAATDTGGSNWASEFQAACAKFTEDNHVTAVLGYEFLFLPSFEQCLQGAKVVHLNEAYLSGGNQTLASYPGLFSLAAPSEEKLSLVQVAGALADGELTTKNKVGLVYSDCADEATAYKNVVVPYLNAHKIAIGGTVTLSCANGTGDAGALAAQISSSILRFESSGVDRVIIPGLGLVIFATGADTQGYHPDYLVTSTTGGAALEPNAPQDQLAHVHGYGYFPGVDVAPANALAQTAPQKRCTDLLKAQGVTLQQYNDFVLAYTTCDSLFLYDTALKADGGRTDLPSVVAAIQSLGTSYPSVIGLNGQSQLAAGHHDALTTYQPWSWNTGCSCFKYTGSPQPIPSS